MTKRGIRFPMFIKFLIGCLTLAAIMIIGGVWVVKNETRLKNRGNYLQKAQRRLDGYIERIGRGMTGTAELLAADPELRTALAADPTAGAGGPSPVAKRMHELLMGKNGIQPDLFLVFTPQNKLVYPTPEKFPEAQLAELAAVGQVRNGSIFGHRLQVIQGIAYQVSAVPVRSATGDAIAAGILIAVKLERYLNEWTESTDEDPTLRTRAALIDSGNILAASWPADKRAELIRATQADKIVKMQVGDDIRDVAKMTEGDYDYFADNEEGYRGNDSVVIGRIILMRSRFTLFDPAERLPWIEIFGGVIASLAIAFLLGFWITRPIKQMVKQSRELLAGETDLTQRIVVRSFDETSDLADNINQVFARVHDLATGVQTAAFQVGASSAEISAASRQMLSGLKDQTLKIEGSTTAVTELSASIQQVAGNAGKAKDVAVQSSSDVNSAVERMAQIRTAVDDAAAKMRELGESSKRIGNIVEVIRQISEQTSMLALNASIEAAHAGEQGRGFAVVADEVSSLARRVGQSAKDIEALIQTVKEQTAAAIASMEVGTREVLNGSQLVTSTLNGLGELVTVVKDTATAVHEQAIVSDDIARSMDAVRHIAGEMLHGSEESVVQAERLHELAFELEESIAGFNLDGKQLQASRAREPEKPEPRRNGNARPAVASGTKEMRQLSSGTSRRRAHPDDGAAGSRDDARGD
ncbi:MAG: HAMP domain-containing protein [Deltaproteobacteria bacterium]|nr:HAMP domain-containing protein [Deltaproteobacteria bacterium]